MPPLAAVDCDPCGITIRHPYTSPETSAPVTGVPVVKLYGSLTVKDPAGGYADSFPTQHVRGAGRAPCVTPIVFSADVASGRR